MKVCILFHRSFDPRYRIPQFIPFLRQKGIESDLVRLSEYPVNRWKQVLEARRYDLVVLQRRLLQPWDVAVLRRSAKRLVFDFDDAVMYRSSKWQNPRSRSRMLKFKKTVQACDLIFAGNSFLKEEAERFISPQKVYVIPTVIDLDRYTPKNHDDSHDGLTLGWIGSRSSLPYLKAIMPALEDLSRRHSIVRLKIVCDRFLDSRHIPVIKKRWEEATEVEDVKSFDVGLMPLSDDVWSKGKCALKIIQSLAVGVPVVCSPVGANREIVKNGSNGFWAKAQSEWIERLSILIENPSLRQDMGRRGRRIVAEKYSVQAIGDSIAQLMWNLVGNMQEF